MSIPAFSAALLSLGLVSLSAVASAAPAGHGPGDVFVMTNRAAGNSIVAYDQKADGTLALADTYATGGLGAPLRPVNPLGSQGALTISGDKKLLFAVNAGSNDLSVFRVEPHGLVLADIMDSGGTFPVSVTEHQGVVYVLNAGGDGSIAGFEVSPEGVLSPIDGSVRSLELGGTTPPTGNFPGQVGFDPSGSMLVVAGKGNQMIHVYPMEDNVPSAAPVTTASAGLVPFDFAFDHQGHLIVAEVGGDGVPVVGDTSVVSSYEILQDGSLEVISETEDTFQRATCWIASAPGSKYVYTANTGGNTLSGFEVSSHGELSLLDGGVSMAFPTGTAPTDIVMSHDGRFVFTLNAGAGSVSAFAVEPDGSLEERGSLGGLGARSGLAGIAAR